MAESDALTYEQDPRRRPALADLHSGLIENDAEYPPSPRDPEANAMNQGDKLLVAAHAVLDTLKIEVMFSGGTPSIVGVWCTATDVEVADFALTDNGAGDTSIVHTGGKLSAAQWRAGVDPVEDVEIDRWRAYPITDGWRVKTKLGAVGTDCRFVLRASGL